MADLVWRRGDEHASDLVWLNSVAQSQASGWEPFRASFEDRIWVLHPWYEDLHDGSDAQRVRWRDIWSRHGLALGEGMTYPPCFWWIVGPGAEVQSRGPFADERIITPRDGTIDPGTMRELAAILPAGEEPLVAVWDILSALNIPGLPETDRGVEVSVRASFADLLASPGMSPNNIWPADRSWLTWTDYDLWATEVHGSRELIAELEASPILETLRWSPPTTEWSP